MKQLHHTQIVLAALIAMSLPVHAEVVDSYADRVEAFQKSRTGKSEITDADREVIMNSNQALKTAMPNPGLKVGDKAPDFTLTGAGGQSITLSEALKRGPVVIAFYRGGWCPYCNIELQALHRSLPAFEKHNAQVIAITPQTVDKSEAQLSENALGFPLLSDLNNDVMKAYKLHFEVSRELSDVYDRNFGINIASYNGPGRRDMPVPGTFVISQDGIIKAAFADPDYKVRMEPAEILKALESL